jgi:hypothetical protein
LTLDTELAACTALAPDFKIHQLAMIDENTVSTAREIEGHGLVRLLGAGTAILIEDAHPLAVLDEFRELFPETIDLLANS